MKGSWDLKKALDCREEASSKPFKRNLATSLPTLTAIAIAIFDSVTVSIGLLTSGVLRVNFLVSAEVKSYR